MFGISKFSEEYRPDWRTEKDLTLFYRFQLTEDIQFTPEYTAVIDPGNHEQTADIAHVFQLRYFLLI